MPTYEYACRSCGNHVEVVQSFSDEPLTTCATCGGPLRKVFGSIGIVLKGSGFYKTDSRAAPSESTSSGNGASAEGPGKSDAPAKKESSSAPASESGGASSGTSTKPAAASS